MGQWDALGAAAGSGGQFMNAFMAAKQQAMQNRLAEQKAAQEAQLAPIELGLKKNQLEATTPQYDASVLFPNAPAGFKLNQPQMVTGLGKSKADIEAEKRAAANAEKMLGQTGTKNANMLRDEFNTVSKPFMTIVPMYQNIRAAATTPTPTAATDMGLIFSYMKILDPNSTVREGEYATAANAGSIPDAIRNQYNRLKDGEKLQPRQRMDFYKSAQQAFKGASDIQAQHIKRYTNLAQRQKVDPQDVVYDFGADFAGDFAPAEQPKQKRYQIISAE